MFDSQLFTSLGKRNVYNVCVCMYVDIYIVTERLFDYEELAHTIKESEKSQDRSDNGIFGIVVFHI